MPASITCAERRKRPVSGCFQRVPLVCMTRIKQATHPLHQRADYPLARISLR